MKDGPLIELRCSSCGEFLGYTVGQMRARYCSISCSNQPHLSQDEARASLIREQRAEGMSQVEIAEFHGISKQTVNWIIQHP